MANAPLNPQPEQRPFHYRKRWLLLLLLLLMFSSAAGYYLANLDATIPAAHAATPPAAAIPSAPAEPAIVATTSNQEPPATPDGTTAAGTTKQQETTPRHLAAASTMSSATNDTPSSPTGNEAAAQTPAATGTASTKPQPYVDQLIAPGGGAGEEQSAEAPSKQPNGRRLYSLEYRYYATDNSTYGHAQEQGLLGRWQQETLNFGTLDLTALVRDYRSDPGNPFLNTGSGGHFTLLQHNFALTPNLLMNNAVGVARTPGNTLINGGYRIRLPSSLIEGVGSQTLSHNGTLTLLSGDTGNYQGTAVQDFQSTQGQLTEAGYEHRFGSRWRAAARIVSLHGHEDVANHETAVGAVEYNNRDNSQDYQLHVMQDSLGHNGSWLDTRFTGRRWTNRFGLYRMDPGLLWTDAPIINDTQGVYARADLSRSLYNVNLGGDWSQTNLNDDPTLAGIDYTNLYANGNYRLNYKLTIGGSLTYQNAAARSGTATQDSDSTSLSGRLSQQSSLGTTRYQLTWNENHMGNFRGQGNKLSIDHDWYPNSALQLTTSLSGERADTSDGSTERLDTGVVWRQSVTGNFNWSGGVGYTQVTGTGATNNFNATVQGDWQISDEWAVSLRGGWNQLKYQDIVSIPGYTPTDRQTESSVYLSVRYTRTEGTPLIAFGRRYGATAGYGRVSGQVFLDENRDGIREANEKVLPGLTVILDGQYPTQTDSQGRFSFEPVPTGPHMVQIAIQDVPLPWGLEKNDRFKVSVPVRGTAELPIPLVKLNN
ncbi:MAG: hypothetical protein P8Y64_04660 [Gammaproteobacteria bacterium]